MVSLIVDLFYLCRLFSFFLYLYVHIWTYTYILESSVHCVSSHQNLQGFRMLHILYNKTYNNDLENFGA